MTQERPCARCIKRNIGHLCHDERRESDSATKKSKTQHRSPVEDDETSPEQPTENGMNSPYEQRIDQSRDNTLGIGQTSMPQNTALQIVQPSPVSGIQASALNSNSNHCMFACFDC